MAECLDRRRGPIIIDCGQGRRPKAPTGRGESLIVSAIIARRERRFLAGQPLIGETKIRRVGIDGGKRA